MSAFLPRLLVGFLSFSAAASAQSVIDPILREQMEQGSQEALHECYLVHQDQLQASDLEPLVRRVPRADRHRIVADALKAHCQRSLEEARQVLRQAEQFGRARLHDELWMGNALIFAAQPAVLEELALIPGTDRIRPVQEISWQANQDVAATPSSTSVASVPFYDDFESGSLGPWWDIETTGDGYVEVRSDAFPEGDFHVVLASSVDGSTSTASMTLRLDLAGHTDVGLRFLHKEFQDEYDVFEGVQISEDGVLYFSIENLDVEFIDYRSVTIDLAAAAANQGLTLTETFHVRFLWDDNFDVPSDGYAFDNIEIGPGVASELAPVATAHVHALQAPRLWELGYRGNGVLIANIDAGVEIDHPDLAERTWVNPGEIPGNLIDDDGNGMIDDIVGWDFLFNDNDPDPQGQTHGTRTAGLMVGDGASGVITGVAPGATMAVCRTLFETNYWSAQQYCLDIGVDVISASVSFKWPERPDYHMHRQLCEMELVAGIIHANSTGNEGQDSSFPVPFNIPAPANCPPPWTYPGNPDGGRTSILACGALLFDQDSLYLEGGQGPAAWDDLALYDATYPNLQNPSFWDYPYGGFQGTDPGIVKPDLVTYTQLSGLTTTSNGASYDVMDGTSAATPQLGGALALLLDVQPAALPRHLAAAVQLTAEDRGAPGKDNSYGAGKLQVFDAARRLVLLASLDNIHPDLGSTVTFDVHGEPMTTSISYLSTGLFADPRFNLVPPLIRFWIHPLDENGHHSFSVPMPVNPVFSGLSLHFQFIASIQNIEDWGPGLLVSVPETLTIGE